MEVPVLWHLKVSNYNEKARWALDYKRLPHKRRAVMPERHRVVAKRLTGGRTFPILVLDGKALGESSEIIAALERLRPKPPLYPADTQTRRRALELEDYFDEELGPHSRVLALHHMLKDGGLFLGAFTPDLPASRRAVARVIFPLLRRRVRASMGVDERSVELAFDKVRAAGEVFRAELSPSGYLAGEDFSVADLTLAALVAPLVAPPEFPYPQPQRDHPLLEPVRRALADAGIFDWTLRMYARHRGQSVEITPEPAPGDRVERSRLRADSRRIS
jgi:glutathione S-transferase